MGSSYMLYNFPFAIEMLLFSGDKSPKKISCLISFH